MEYYLEYVSHKKAPNNFYYIIKCTFTYIYYKWFKKVVESSVVEYYGNSTVWRTFPKFKRCTTDIETLLVDIWQKIKYEESFNKENR